MAPTRQDFIDQFRAAETIPERNDVLYAAACSKLWKKCKGKLGRDEDRCIAGLICELAGVPVSAVGVFHFSKFDGYASDRERKAVDTDGENFPYRRLVGFNPFEDGVAVDVHFEAEVSPYSLNDDHELGLCEIAELSRDWVRTGEVKHINLDKLDDR